MGGSDSWYVSFGGWVRHLVGTCQLVGSQAVSWYVPFGGWVRELVGTCQLVDGSDS